jgi:hypothetical protein
MATPQDAELILKLYELRRPIHLLLRGCGRGERDEGAESNGVTEKFFRERHSFTSARIQRPDSLAQPPGGRLKASSPRKSRKAREARGKI